MINIEREIELSRIILHEALDSGDTSLVSIEDLKYLNIYINNLELTLALVDDEIDRLNYITASEEYIRAKDGY